MTDVRLRPGTTADAEALDALIRSHQEEGHLLPRLPADIRRRAGHFVVCEVAGTVEACAELAPLSPSVAEIRSLVVSGSLRRVGVGAKLVEEVGRRARAAGFETLCALTHDARFFVRQDFSLVPHVSLPAKIEKDCAGCPTFRRCGQRAMVLPLQEGVRYGVADVDRRQVAAA